MEDIDTDIFTAKMKALEAEGKPVEKDTDGNTRVPKFELNLILKVKRKHLEMKGTLFTDKFDLAAQIEVMESDID